MGSSSTTKITTTTAGENARTTTTTTTTNAGGYGEQALKVACLVFDELRSDTKVRANHVTYGTFLGVIGRFMPDHASSSSPSSSPSDDGNNGGDDSSSTTSTATEKSSSQRDQMVELVFQRAKQQGLVSKLVLKKLHLATASNSNGVQYYEHLLEGYTENSLPTSWTCNVREQKARYETS